eukprot:SAG11_NODE_1936_length_4032_cov_8.888380_2_plen_33_part_00
MKAELAELIKTEVEKAKIEIIRKIEEMLEKRA